MVALSLIFQVGNYGIGGTYLTHLDSRDRQKVESSRRILSDPGQSVASILMVLRAPNAGTLYQSGISFKSSPLIFLLIGGFFYSILDFYHSGGRTIWPLAGVTSSAQSGDGILWYNVFKNEKIDNATYHQGCGVISGSKWIGNKWIGYNNQWNTIKCGLSENEKFDVFV